jgi:hypothetical protein
MGGVVGCRVHDSEVVWPVVCPVAVTVVDMLGAKEAPPETLLCDVAVFEHAPSDGSGVLVADPQRHIAVLADDSIAPGVRLGRWSTGITPVAPPASEPSATTNAGSFHAVIVASPCIVRCP